LNVLAYGLVGRDLEANVALLVSGAIRQHSHGQDQEQCQQQDNSLHDQSLLLQLDSFSGEKDFGGPT